MKRKFTIREVLAQLRLEVNAKKHPRTAAALRELECAMLAEASDKTRQHTSRLRKAWRNKVNYLNNKISSLKSKLAAFTLHHTSTGRVTQDWILKVFLASPHASGRALADSFRLVAGFDSNAGGATSRPSIAKIKAAWVEMFVPMVKASVRDNISAGLRTCAHTSRPFLPVILVHVQDEADMRLRSGIEREGVVSLPRRGRASKVQVHVMRVVVGHHEQEVPLELEALADKGTNTLATSLEGVLRNTCRDILPTTIPLAGPEIWLVHLVIGDAIPTNDAAARVIWASITNNPLGRGIKHFMLTVKCMTHQAGLAARSGVEGFSASTAGPKQGNDNVPGAATRLFKYLINDYYEEFTTNVATYVATRLHVVSQDEADRTLLGRGQDVNNLREVYTDHVIPDEMQDLWNVGANDLVHRLASGSDADALASRPALVNRFANFIVKRLLTPDEHPTITRFFTFRQVIDAMLTMDIIGLPQHLLKLSTMKPQEENQKRLKLLQGFFSSPEAKQALRRASLVLQLTGGVEALSSAKVKEAGDPPRIVSFVRGEAHKLVDHRLRHLLITMHKDPLLKPAPALSVLVATSADLILRFNKLKEYPFVLCLMSKRWFRTTYLHAILAFLQEEPDKLDVGVSMQLRDIAYQGRNQAQALNWLQSDPVQEFLNQIADQLLVHSLDAERKAAQTKRWESTKVTHIATASLNNISVRFAKQRESKSLAIEQALQKLRQVQRIRVTSIAWKDNDLRPHGCRFEHGNRFNSSDSSCGSPPHPGGSTLSNDSVDSGSPGSVKNQPTIGPARVPKRTVDEVQLYNYAMEKDRLVSEAKAEVNRLLESCVLPVTRHQWGAWLDLNIHEFRERMKTAVINRRRANCRLQARQDLPELKSVSRLQPRRVVGRLHASWAVNLAGRGGWHGVKLTSGAVRMFFLVRHDRQTFVVDLEPYRVDGLLPCGYELGQSFNLQESLKLLSSLEAEMPQVSAAYSFAIEASPLETGRGLRLNPSKGAEVTGPLPRKKQGDIGDDVGDPDEVANTAEHETNIYEEEQSSDCVVRLGLLTTSP